MTVLLILALLCDMAALLHLLRVLKDHAGTGWSGRGKLMPIVAVLGALIVGAMLLVGFGHPTAAAIVAAVPAIAAVVMFGGVLLIYIFMGGRPN